MQIDAVHAGQQVRFAGTPFELRDRLRRAGYRSGEIEAVAASRLAVVVAKSDYVQQVKVQFLAGGPRTILTIPARQLAPRG